MEGWEAIYNNPSIWHFRFNGPTPEDLVKGRERTYFEHFWNDFAADKTHSIPEADRREYAAAYASRTDARGLDIFRIVSASRGGLRSLRPNKANHAGSFHRRRAGER